MRRITSLATAAWLFLIFGAENALAQESGAGRLPVTEKLITEFGLGLIFGFPVFLFLMSWLQSSLEKRKDRKKAAYRSSKGATAWKGGW